MIITDAAEAVDDPMTPVYRQEIAELQAENERLRGEIRQAMLWLVSEDTRPQRAYELLRKALEPREGAAP